MIDGREALPLTPCSSLPSLESAGDAAAGQKEETAEFDGRRLPLFVSIIVMGSNRELGLGRWMLAAAESEGDIVDRMLPDGFPAVRHDGLSTPGIADAEDEDLAEDGGDGLRSQRNWHHGLSADLLDGSDQPSETSPAVGLGGSDIGDDGGIWIISSSPSFWMDRICRTDVAGAVGLKEDDGAPYVGASAVH
ncbi:hypothetical protein ACLOJK_036308 [Asimina triloba]